MRRRVYALSAVAGLVMLCAVVFPRGSGGAGRGRLDLYAVARDGAQEFLSATFSVSAAVLNWLDDRYGPHPC